MEYGGPRLLVHDGGQDVEVLVLGDGWDEARFVDHVENGDAPERMGESFTVWYGKEGASVGVLSHNYDEGRGMVERGAPLPR